MDADGTSRSEIVAQDTNHSSGPPTTPVTAAGENRTEIAGEREDTPPRLGDEAKQEADGSAENAARAECAGEGDDGAPTPGGEVTQAACMEQQRAA